MRASRLRKKGASSARPRRPSSASGRIAGARAEKSGEKSGTGSDFHDDTALPVKPGKSGPVPDFSVSRDYPDLHEHLEALRKRGLLLTIDRLVDKDAELHPLVRWQFVGGMDEAERKAFLFTNITDGRGRKYDI